MRSEELGAKMRSPARPDRLKFLCITNPVPTKPGRRIIGEEVSCEAKGHFLADLQIEVCS